MSGTTILVSWRSRMPIRPIETRDNLAIAKIIRQSLKAVGLDQQGTAYTDPQLDNLYDYYNELSNAAYFVYEEGNQVIAGAGFGPVDASICELQKCYVDENHRRKGIAKAMLLHVESVAKAYGYQSLYLESSSLLKEAVSFYKSIGFKQLKQALPNEQNHHLMDIWMIKDLEK